MVLICHADNGIVGKADGTPGSSSKSSSLCSVLHGTQRHEWLSHEQQDGGGGGEGMFRPVRGWVPLTRVATEMTGLDRRAHCWMSLWGL